MKNRCVMKWTEKVDRKQKRWTEKEMATALCINRSAVSKHLKHMQAEGVIRRVGPDKGGHWEVTGH